MFSNPAFLLAIALVVLAIFLVTRYPFSGVIGFIGRGIATLLLALILLMLGFWGVADSFTEQGIDGRVIYHLIQGLDGAGIAGYKGTVFAGCAYLLLCLVFLIWFWRKSGQKTASRTISETDEANPKKQANPKSKKGLLGRGVALASLSLAVLFNPVTLDIHRLSTARLAPAPSFSEIEDFIVPDQIHFGEKRNFVLIYMESFERTFLNEEVFPELAPNLRQLEAGNTHATQMEQVFFTDFTMGGLVATQCGVPMYGSGDPNSMDNIDRFLPNARCMGDILKTAGYDLTFMGGADLDFAGKGAFLRQHGIDHLIGKAEFAAEFPDPKDMSAWGLHDDKLLPRLVKQYKTLSEQGAPFGLLALTLDTHAPNGFLSQRCRKDFKYKSNPKRILRAANCTDHLIADTVKALRASPGGDDLLIVLMSDHLAMPNTASAELKSAARQNYFVVLDPRIKKPKTLSAPSSTLDVAPTLLSLIGADIEALGFGRNLFGKETTLTEKHADKINPVLMSYSKALGEHLWDYPKMPPYIQVDISGAEQARLKIGETRINLPAIIYLDAGRQIEGYFFDHPNHKDFPDYILAGLHDNQRYVWIDDCPRVSARFNPDKPALDAGWCVAETNGAGETHMTTISDGEKYKVETALAPSP